ncbi:MAG: hypothetical protein ACE5GW_09390 [Planctomycetota bacterium]
MSERLWEHPGHEPLPAHSAGHDGLPRPIPASLVVAAILWLLLAGGWYALGTLRSLEEQVPACGRLLDALHLTSGQEEP